MFDVHVYFGRSTHFLYNYITILRSLEVLFILYYLVGYFKRRKATLLWEVRRWLGKLVSQFGRAENGHKDAHVRRAPWPLGARCVSSSLWVYPPPPNGDCSPPVVATDSSSTQILFRDEEMFYWSAPPELFLAPLTKSRPSNRMHNYCNCGSK